MASPATPDIVLTDPMTIGAFCPVQPAAGGCVGAPGAGDGAAGEPAAWPGAGPPDAPSRLGAGFRTPAEEVAGAAPADDGFGAGGAAPTEPGEAPVEPDAGAGAV
jgi:hypothetical protein